MGRVGNRERIGGQVQRKEQGQGRCMTGGMASCMVGDRGQC